jgi:hypothetical protein
MAAALLWATLSTSVIAEEAAAAVGGRWQGPDGSGLPFRTDEEILAFLRDAEPTLVKEITSGINRPLKVLLTRGGVTAHAIFRDVDVRKTRFVSNGNVYVDFRDSHVFEYAAYEVSRLLGIDAVPPCVKRRLWGKIGSLQVWVENAITEEKRRQEKRQAPAALSWVRQQQTLRLFDALIKNLDRNQGNMLIDERWKLWFIDHTRSFHRSPEIERIERIVWCDREVWEKLKALDRETFEKRLGDDLNSSEIRSLLKRRDRLVRHIEERIAAIGEELVLFSTDTPPPEGFESHPDFAAASASEDIPEKSEELEGGGL